MQVVINIPDNLSQTRVEQLIQELEQKLQEEAELISSQPQTKSKSKSIEALLEWCDKHRFTLEGNEIPSREERNAR